jgi:TolA-binding protein
MRFMSSRLLATCAVASLLVCGAVPAQADDSTEGRLNKVEAEVRALQRKVFPGGDGRFFEPQISPAAPPATTGPATPTTTPVTDLLGRMDAVEAQMNRLTAQIEQNTNRINQLEAKLGGANGAASLGAAATVPATTPAAATAPAATTPASQANLSAMTGGAASVQPAAVTKPVTKPAVPSAARLQAVQAIVKPQTDDPGDDEYSYGFRLWDAKFYPEAEQQLKLFLEKYPKHSRASWGRNLLGRAYLDDGNPLEAAKWFVQNYQADKNGDRAPDSLLYLAVSMKQLKDTKRACIALAEFSQVYAAEAAGRLKSVYDSTRNGLTCN